MDTDDLELPKRVAKPAPKPLDPLSVEELKAYIAELKAEIERVEAKLAAKQSHLAAAAGLFKS